jgi:hypothetical protein
MNETRHNSHLIVTVLTACVALMCGVPAGQAAPATPISAQLPANYAGFQGVPGETRSAQFPNVGPARAVNPSARPSRFRRFKPASFLQFFQLAAVLPGFNFRCEPATFPLELHSLGENTRSLTKPNFLRIVTRLPRAGIA